MTSNIAHTYFVPVASLCRCGVVKEVVPPINLRLPSLYNPPPYLARALLTQLERIEVSLNELMYYVMYHTHIVIPVKDDI
jgi:hypothetical protein